MKNQKTKIENYTFNCSEKWGSLHNLSIILHHINPMGMNVQFYYPDGKPVIFQEIDRRQYRGLLLPGSQVQQSHLKAARITVQQFKEGAVGIRHILLEIFSKIRLLIQADEGLRLEALLSGDTYITHKGSKRKFRAGEYRITDEPSFRALFKKNTACHIFICCYPAELLATLGIEIFYRNN